MAIGAVWVGGGHRIADEVFGHGKASDELFPGDWNNDNLDTFAVRRIE